MRIVCESCGTSYRIPKEKLTKAVHRATCKRCGNKIVIRVPGSPLADDAPAVAAPFIVPPPRPHGGFDPETTSPSMAADAMEVHAPPMEPPDDLETTAPMEPLTDEQVDTAPVVAPEDMLATQPLPDPQELVGTQPIPDPSLATAGMPEEDPDELASTQPIPDPATLAAAAAAMGLGDAAAATGQDGFGTTAEGALTIDDPAPTGVGPTLDEDEPGLEPSPATLPDAESEEPAESAEPEGMSTVPSMPVMMDGDDADEAPTPMPETEDSGASASEPEPEPEPDAAADSIADTLDEDDGPADSDGAASGGAPGGAVAALGVLGVVGVVLTALGIPASGPAAGVPLGLACAGGLGALGTVIPPLRKLGLVPYVLICLVVGLALGVALKSLA